MVGPLKEGPGAEAEAAVGALQNIVRGNAANKEALHEANAIPELIALLSASPFSEASLEAVETLDELACDHPAAAEAIRPPLRPARKAARTPSRHA